MLPKDPKERKTYPLWSGLMQYFPDALAAVAHVSYVGNEQHNPGQSLHWAREKSADQEDTLLRHLMERGTVDSDGIRHSAKVAWRALAMLQLELEAEAEAATPPADLEDRSTFGRHIPPIHGPITFEAREALAGHRTKDKW